jgi:hypothetical protein
VIAVSPWVWAISFGLALGIGYVCGREFRPASHTVSDHPADRLPEEADELCEWSASWMGTTHHTWVLAEDGFTTYWMLETMLDDEGVRTLFAFEDSVDGGDGRYYMVCGLCGALKKAPSSWEWGG